jgi:hypothetical protein
MYLQNKIQLAFVLLLISACGIKFKHEVSLKEQPRVSLDTGKKLDDALKALNNSLKKGNSNIQQGFNDINREVNNFYGNDAVQEINTNEYTNKSSFKVYLDEYEDLYALWLKDDPTQGIIFDISKLEIYVNQSTYNFASNTSDSNTIHSY